MTGKCGIMESAGQRVETTNVGRAQVYRVEQFFLVMVSHNVYGYALLFFESSLYQRLSRRPVETGPALITERNLKGFFALTVKKKSKNCF